MNWVMPWGLSNCPPFSFEEHVLVLQLLILVFLPFGWRVWSHPSMGGEGPSSGGWEHSTSGRQTYIIIPPDMGGTYPFHSLLLFVWPWQPWPSLVSVCILLGSLSATVNWPWCHSVCLTYMFLPRSMATSTYLRSSPIFCGHSSGHPWQKS